VKTYRFRDFVLNPLERSLVKNGERLNLTPKAFDVLQLLVENAGEIVTKDQILGKVWEGQFVEEGNLPVQMSKLRHILNETTDERFIDTVTGTGYRFISSVETIENNGPIGIAFTDNGHNSESHRLYLKGSLFENKRTRDGLEKAIEYLQKSISADPINLHAYTEIINCYRTLYTYDFISYSEVQSKILPYTKTASELGKDDDHVQTILGAVSLTLNWDFAAAEMYFRRALEINGENFWAHDRLASLLIYSTSFSEALLHIKHLMALDPLSVKSLISVGRLLYAIGMLDSAIFHLDEALEIEPADYEALIVLGFVFIQLDKHSEAIALLEKANQAHQHLDAFMGIGIAQAHLGNKKEARRIIVQIKAAHNSPCKSSIKLARIYVALGETKKAFDYLEKAFDEHDVDLLALKVDPTWKAIRDDQRFKDLIKKVGIP